MEISYQKELEKIKKIINKKPRGITVKEIAKNVGVNRNVASKYLDVLQIEGEVEVEKFGRSKVYFSSKSIPISTMFDYSNDYILVVRKDMTAVEINTPFTKYLGLLDKNKIVGKDVKNLVFAKSYPEIIDNIIKTLEKQQILEDEIEYKRNKNSKADHLRLRFVPTVLSDGESGVAIIISKFIKK